MEADTSRLVLNYIPRLAAKHTRGHVLFAVRRASTNDNLMFAGVDARRTLLSAALWKAVTASNAIAASVLASCIISSSTYCARCTWDAFVIVDVVIVKAYDSRAIRKTPS